MTPMLPLLAPALVAFGALWVGRRRARDEETLEGHTFHSPAPFSIPSGSMHRLWSPWDYQTGQFLYPDARQRLSTGGSAFYGRATADDLEGYRAELERDLREQRPDDPPKEVRVDGDVFVIVWPFRSVPKRPDRDYPRSWYGHLVSVRFEDPFDYRFQSTHGGRAFYSGDGCASCPAPKPRQSCPGGYCPKSSSCTTTSCPCIKCSAAPHNNQPSGLEGASRPRYGG